MIKMNPLITLLHMISTCIVVFFVWGIKLQLLHVGIVLLFVFLFSDKKFFFRTLLWSLFIILIYFYLDLKSAEYESDINYVKILAPAFLVFIQMLPAFIMIGFLVNRLKITEFINALTRLKVHKNLVLPLSVTLRFFPMLKQEIGFIKDAMRIRGLNTSAVSWITKPMQTFELIIIPILMRSLKIADEMSASAITRGLGRYKDRTNYINYRFSAPDFLYTVITLTYLGILIYFSR